MPDVGTEATSSAPGHPVAPIQDTETPEQRNARLAWWRDARFGMFVHWGLYAIPAGFWRGEKVLEGTGEWIMNYAKIPVAEYKALAKQFNPVQFDADSWVLLAKRAGMKYIVITAKHHDGFALFQSAADDFNIVDATPFKRDILRELADSCDRQGIRLGFYYSQDLDWSAPGGGSYRGYWDEAQDGGFDTYLETKAIPQIEELLANYKPHPAIVWFDYPTDNMTPELASRVVAVLNRRPDLIWNNRLGGGYAGDTPTPEQHIPADGFEGRAWEACMTMNDTWGYKSDDQDYKSTETILRHLIDIAAKGGNYLLNVGPDASGVIPQPQRDRLTEIGDWLAINGEAIYGTNGSAFADTQINPPVEWRCTTKPGKLYIHLFEWPGEQVTIHGVTENISGAYLLARPATPLTSTQSGSNITITLPSHAPDPIATVLVLEHG